MKKSQRARLAELTAKAATARTDAEQAEFAALSALAVGHPDAAKDTDDTTPAAAAATPAPAAAANQPGTLRGFLQSLRTGAQTGAELVAAREQVATVTAERDTARAETTAARGETTAVRAEVAVLAGQVAAFAAFFGFEATALAGKKTEEVAALIRQKISTEAADQIAALGLPAAKLPKATTAEAAEKSMPYAEWSKLSPFQQAKFIQSGGEITDAPSFSRN